MISLDVCPGEYKVIFLVLLSFQEYEAIYLAKLTIKMMSPMQLGRSFSLQAGVPGWCTVNVSHAGGVFVGTFSVQFSSCFRHVQVVDKMKFLLKTFECFGC